MLTTKDNPYNPFTEYDQWLQWDTDAGYYTNNLLARYANISFEMSEEEAEPIIDAAMALIVENDLSENYKIVQPNDYLQKVSKDK